MLSSDGTERAKIILARELFQPDDIQAIPYFAFFRFPAQ